MVLGVVPHKRHINKFDAYFVDSICTMSESISPVPMIPKTKSFQLPNKKYLIMHSVTNLAKKVNLNQVLRKVFISKKTTCKNRHGVVIKIIR